MRRMKKFAALSMSLCFAVTSMFGCTKKGSTDPTEADSITTQADTAKAAEVEQTEATATVATTTATEDTKPSERGRQDDETQGSEAATRNDSSSEPKTPVVFEDIDTNDALTGFLNMMDGVDAVKMTFELNMNVANAYPGEWSLGGTDGVVKIKLDCQWDIDRLIADGSLYATVDTDTVKFNDELLSFVIDTHEIQVATKLPDLLADLFGGKEQIDVLMNQFDVQVSFADLQRVCRFNIPIGSAVLNSMKVDEDARQFVLGYLTRILSEVDARSITGSDNDITVEVNGAFLTSLLRSAAKHTKDSDYEFFFKYLQESGTPSYNEAELKAAIDRLSEQINKGLTKANSLFSVSSDDLLDFASRLYGELSDDAGAQMFNDAAEMERTIRSMFEDAAEHIATKEGYEKTVQEYDKELVTVFKDGSPKFRIRYDDKAKTADISADFIVTDEATGEKIDMNCVMHLEKTDVKLQKIKDTVEFSEVVYVSYKFLDAMQGLLGPMMSVTLDGFDLSTSFDLD
ncbi:MAG: hypothetical protein J5757_08170 [Lachnospiraceae bacterium]|nr:hypothetical protein [Lachnospiraceae bacterium]